MWPSGEKGGKHFGLFFLTRIISYTDYMKTKDEYSTAASTDNQQHLHCDTVGLLFKKYLYVGITMHKRKQNTFIIEQHSERALS